MPWVLRQLLLFIVILCHLHYIHCNEAIVQGSDLIDIQFQGPLLAQRATDVIAAFSTSETTSNQPLLGAEQQQGRVELVGIGSDLDWFFNIRPNVVTPTDNALLLEFRNFTFPAAGQYLLAFNGELPGGRSAVVASTLLGVGGPDSLAMTAFNSSSIGATEIVVTSVTARALQLHALRLSSLLQHPAVANATKHSSSSSSSNQYRVTLEGPAHCKPGVELPYKWSIYNASSNEPITDLVPVAGAAMRLIVVSSDFSYLEHTVGDVTLGNSKAEATAITTSSSSSSSGFLDSKRARLHAAGVEEEAAPLLASAAVSASNSSGASRIGARGLLQQLSQPPGSTHAGVSKLVAGQHDTAAIQWDRSSGSSSSSRLSGGGGGGGVLLGPSAYTQVVVPLPGTYLLIGEMRRGDDERIIAPFYISCSYEAPVMDAGNAPVAASSSAGAGLPGGSVMRLLWAGFLGLVVQVAVASWCCS